MDPLPRVVKDRDSLPISGKVRVVRVVKDRDSPPISGKARRVVALREVLQGSLSSDKPLRVVLHIHKVVSRVDPPPKAHSLGKALKVGLRDFRGSRDPPLAVARLSLRPTRISMFFLRTAFILSA